MAGLDNLGSNLPTARQQLAAIAWLREPANAAKPKRKKSAA